MDRLYKILIIDDDEYSADNLCLELKRYGQLVVEGRNRTVRANQQLCHVEYASDFLYCLRQIYD